MNFNQYERQRTTTARKQVHAIPVVMFIVMFDSNRLSNTRSLG